MSTKETTFPDIDKPVPKGQIICSCSINEAKPGTCTAGYQILGPYPCDKSNTLAALVMAISITRVISEHRPRRVDHTVASLIPNICIISRQ